MRKLLGALLGVYMLLAWPVLAQEPDARAILEKAVKAHGGAKILSKFRASHSRSKGKIHLGAGLNFTAEEDIQLPDKYRSDIQLDVNGMNISITQVFDGTKGWVDTMGKTVDLDDKTNTEIKEILHATRVGNLVDVLRDKSFKLAPLGEAKVKDKDAIGVRISLEGRRDVNLYFDKGSGLLVKTEGRGLDPINKQEINQEKYFSDYHDVAGRQTPRKVEVHNDGKLFVEAEVLEIQLLEKHDDSKFKRP